MRKTISGSVLALFISLLIIPSNPCAAQQTSTNQEKPKLSDSGWSNKKIQDALDKNCSLQYEQTPWNEIESVLEDRLGCNIVLSNSARDDSLTEDEPITCNLTNVKFRTGMRIVLNNVNATFYVRKGVIHIISRDDLDDVRYMSNFIIDVNSLLAEISKREGTRIGQASSGQQTSASETSKDSLIKSTNLNTSESLLIDLIETTFKPESWQSSGNGSATIKILGGQAVVLCHDEMADDLRDFLQDLESKMAK